jgi:hypothetical protein
VESPPAEAVEGDESDAAGSLLHAVKTNEKSRTTAHRSAIFLNKPFDIFFPPFSKLSSAEHS